MERIAIIPARGGSKRLTNKNIYEINGIPLIGYTIIAGLKWDKFNDIFVNSEDATILKCAQEYGAKPYRRPGELGGDSIKVLDVVKEQISTMQLPSETEIAVLLPTCPLRTEADIENAYSLFVKNNSLNSVVSMTEYEKAPEQAFFVNEKGLLQRKFPSNYSSRSQDHSAAYRYNTAIIYTTAGLFMKQDDIVGSASIPYVMPYERSIDIDYEYHIKIIELIMTATQRI
jgi:CMP-N-acetylneuraminic acid synthetase